MLSVLVPWRSEDPYRVAAWDYMRRLWERLPVQLCVADDGLTGAFSVTRALNRARLLAQHDRLLLYGADQLPPSLERLRLIETELNRVPWLAVYARTRVFSPQATMRILRGEPPGVFADPAWSHTIGMCTGILALGADVWDDLGGTDERFIGWGAEDTAFRLALRTLYPDGRDVGEGELWSLWHPDRHGTAEMTAANAARYAEYERAAAEGRMREYLREVRGGGSGDDR